MAAFAESAAADTKVGLPGAGTGEPPIRGMSCNPDPPRLQVNTVLDSWKALMRQAGPSGVFTIFILTCAPVQTALLAEHFAKALSSSLSFHVPLPSPLLSAGPPPYPPVLGDIEEHSPHCLPHQPCLSRCLRQPFECPHRFLAFTMIKSKIITLSHLSRSPPQRRFLYSPNSQARDLTSSWTLLSPSTPSIPSNPVDFQPFQNRHWTPSPSFIPLAWL